MLKKTLIRSLFIATLASTPITSIAIQKTEGQYTQKMIQAQTYENQQSNKLEQYLPEEKSVDPAPQTISEFNKILDYIKFIPSIYEMSKLSCPEGTVKIGRHDGNQRLELNNCTVLLGTITGEMSIKNNSFKRIGLIINNSYMGQMKISSASFSIKDMSENNTQIKISTGMIVFGEGKNNMENGFSTNRMFIEEADLLFVKKENSNQVNGIMITQEGFLNIVEPLDITKQGTTPTTGKIIYRNDKGSYYLIFKNGKMEVQIPEDIAK